MQRWEYKVLTAEAKGWFQGVDIDVAGAQRLLNSQGDDGWELVSSFDTNQGHGSSRYYVFLLKRAKE